MCLLRQIFVATKVVLQQKYFVMTNNFVTTKVLSWQAYFCLNKRRDILTTQTHVCRDKTFVIVIEVGSGICDPAQF